MYMPETMADNGADKVDDFEVRSIARYLLGQGFPPSCNTGTKRKISHLAGWHTIIDGVLYRNSGFQPTIDLSVTANDSRSAVILWDENLYRSIMADCKVVIIVYTLKNNMPVHVKHSSYQVGSSTVTGLETGLDYVISAEFVRFFNINRQWQYIVAQAYQHYRSVLRKGELNLLLDRAKDFVKGDPCQNISVFYRNKPNAYFEDIFKHDGVMYPYMKDFNGDLGCPINGQIEGLFFAGRTERNGCLPNHSWFGDTRFVIPADRLFHEGMNLYFADFYCHSNVHYVTVVLADRCSNIDKFCDEHLLSLSPTENPFLTLSPFQIAEQVHVEVFYTSPVDLRLEMALDDRCQMGKTLTRGRGSSKVEGIVKNPNCNVCNLYRTKRKREESEFTAQVKTKVKQGLKVVDLGIAARQTLKAKRRNMNSQPSAAQSVSDTKLSVKSEVKSMGKDESSGITTRHSLETNKPKKRKKSKTKSSSTQSVKPHVKSVGKNASSGIDGRPILKTKKKKKSKKRSRSRSRSRSKSKPTAKRSVGDNKLSGKSVSMVKDPAKAFTSSKSMVGYTAKASTSSKSMVKDTAKASTSSKSMVKDTAKASTSSKSMVGDTAKASTSSKSMVKETAKASTTFKSMVGDTAKASTSFKSMVKDTNKASTSSKSMVKETANASAKSETVVKQSAMTSTKSPSTVNETAMTSTNSVGIVKETTNATSNSERMVEVQSKPTANCEINKIIVEQSTESRHAKPNTSGLSPVGQYSSPALISKELDLNSNIIYRDSQELDLNSNIVYRENLNLSPKKIERASPTGSYDLSTKEDPHKLTSLQQSLDIGKTKEDCSIGKGDWSSFNQDDIDFAEILQALTPVIDLTNDDRAIRKDVAQSCSTVQNPKSKETSSLLNPLHSSIGFYESQPKSNLSQGRSSQEAISSTSMDKENQQLIGKDPEPPKYKRFKLDQ